MGQEAASHGNRYQLDDGQLLNKKVGLKIIAECYEQQ